MTNLNDDINPDAVSHALLFMAGDQSGPPRYKNPSDFSVLRQAATLISDQSKTIGVLHTEHAAAMAQIKTLREALEFATAYVRKSVCDGQMEDCAVPASLALKRLDTILKETQR